MELFVKCFLVKCKKSEQQKHVTGWIFDLVFEKLTHKCSLIAAVAVLSELSRCSSEISHEILLFLCFILENDCSQMHAMPMNEDTNKVQL